MLDPKHKGTALLHSIRSFSPSYIVLPCRKPQTSSTPLQEPQISWCHTTFSYATTTSYFIWSVATVETLHWPSSDVTKNWRFQSLITFT